jgi:hypothetical protein
MALRLLPDLEFPVTSKQINPLMDNIVNLNILDAGLTENYQRALGIHFHIFDTWIKTGGKLDYRGIEGHKRLVADSMAFVGGSPVTTKHGDLAAAHLSIDYHDTQIRLKSAGQPALVSDVNQLIRDCIDLSQFAVKDEIRVGLYMDYIGKKSLL